MFSSELTSIKNNIVHYLTHKSYRSEISQQLHIGSSTKYPELDLSNSTVKKNMAGDIAVSNIDKYEKLLNENVTVLIWAGGFDVLDGPTGIQKWMRELKYYGMNEFNA